MVSTVRGDVAQHSVENQLVHRVHAKPVGPSEQSHRIEGGGLPNRAPGRIACYFELEPGAAGQFHLGGEAQPVMGFEGFHAPTVHGIAHAEVVGITAAAA